MASKAEQELPRTLGRWWWAKPNHKAIEARNATASPLLALPVEIRMLIWDELLHGSIEAVLPAPTCNNEACRGPQVEPMSIKQKQPRREPNPLGSLQVIPIAYASLLRSPDASILCYASRRSVQCARCATWCDGIGSYARVADIERRRLLGGGGGGGGGGAEMNTRPLPLMLVCRQVGREVGRRVGLCPVVLPLLCSAWPVRSGRESFATLWRERLRCAEVYVAPLGAYEGLRDAPLVDVREVRRLMPALRRLTLYSSGTVGGPEDWDGVRIVRWLTDGNWGPDVELRIKLIAAPEASEDESARERRKGLGRRLQRMLDEAREERVYYRDNELLEQGEQDNPLPSKPSYAQRFSFGVLKTRKLPINALAAAR